jgi:steroid 5-alpha reductase family enzyme
MDFFTTLYSVALVILCYVTVLFGISLLIKRNDIADIGWGIGILLVGITSFFKQENTTVLMIFLLGLVTLWALRLSIRIFVRNIKKKKEDFRYKEWRDTWGTWFYVRSFFQVYILQGTLMILVAYPLVHVSVFDTGTFSITLLLIGSILWLFGFMFEAVSDYQLDRFIGNSENKGKLMRSGLWQYSRHPNYFGEVVQWWGIWCTVLSLPYGLYAVISPLVITFLILKVSGIPMLEKGLKEHPEFEEYKKTTSEFIPLPKRMRI